MAKNTETVPGADKDAEQSELSHPAERKYGGSNSLKAVWQFAPKLEIHTPCDQATAPAGMWPIETHARACCRRVQSSSVPKTQKTGRERNAHSLQDGYVRCPWYVHTAEFCLEMK